MKLLLAISGGIDSCVLLNQFCTAGKDELTIAYFNHGTAHGKKAEKVVQKLAEKYQLPLEIGETKKKLKSENDFREARWVFLRRTAKKIGAERIVTAHHADDQAETVLFNLVRGTGLAGLAGMTADTGEILRPLLSLPKSEITKYARKHRLNWIEEASNQNVKFSRNRLRKHILPELAKINPQITMALLRTAKQAGEADAFIQKKAAAWLRRNADKQQIELSKFVKIELVLARVVLREIHRQEIGHTQQLEEVHIAEVLELARSGLGNKQKKCGQLVFKTLRNTSKKRVLIWQKTS